MVVTDKVPFKIEFQEALLPPYRFMEQAAQSSFPNIDFSSHEMYHGQLNWSLLVWKSSSRVISIYQQSD